MKHSTVAFFSLSFLISNTSIPIHVIVRFLQAIIVSAADTALQKSTMVQSLPAPSSLLDVKFTHWPGGNVQTEKNSSPPLQPQRGLSVESIISNTGDLAFEIPNVKSMKRISKNPMMLLSSFQPQWCPDKVIDAKYNTAKSVLISDKKFKNNPLSKVSLKPPIQPQRAISVTSNLTDESSRSGTMAWVHRSISLKNPEHHKTTNENDVNDCYFDLVVISNPRSMKLDKYSTFSNVIKKDCHVHNVVPQIVSTKYKPVISISSLTLDTFDEDNSEPRRRSSRYSASRSPSKLALIDENGTFFQNPSTRHNVEYNLVDCDVVVSDSTSQKRNVDIVLPGLDQDWHHPRITLDIRSFSFSRASSVSSCTFDLYADDLSKLNPTCLVLQTSGFSAISSMERSSMKDRSAPVPPRRQDTWKTIETNYSSRYIEGDDNNFVKSNGFR